MTSSFTDSIQALDQQLIQLVYRSRSLIEGAEYDKLMATCLRNNPSRGITGVLISHSGWFLQVLEGSAVNVNSLSGQRQQEAVFATADALDADDFRTQVTQQASAVRTRNIAPEIEHANTVKNSSHQFVPRS